MSNKWLHYVNKYQLEIPKNYPTDSNVRMKFISDIKIQYVLRECIQYAEANNLFQTQWATVNELLIKVHMHHNLSLLKGSKFQGCDEHCIWEFGDPYCSCGQSQYMWDLTFVNFSDNFSLDNQEPVGELVRVIH